jgi:hypothetical protein
MMGGSRWKFDDSGGAAIPRRAGSRAAKPRGDVRPGRAKGGLSQHPRQIALDRLRLANNAKPSQIQGGRGSYLANAGQTVSTLGANSMKFSRAVTK